MNEEKKEIEKTKKETNEDIEMEEIHKKFLEEQEDLYKSHNRKTNKKKKKKDKIPLLIITTIILSLFSGIVGAYLILTYCYKNETTITNAVELTETNSISTAVEKIYDSVVVVESYKSEQLYSTGTGFAYKKEGKKVYLMTNNHVVSGSDSVKLILSDNSEVDANIVGTDTYSDIAVLSIADTDKITVAELDDSGDNKIGDTVFAVGAPEGSEYAGTVTKGILSGKDRLVEVSFTNNSTSDYYMSVIQTDAAINPGNSGGPLCNANGEVIGITNMKLVDSSVEGMGFAIPIKDALYYAEILETEGKVARPYIGISMMDITENSYYLWRANINIPEGVTEGVVIYLIEENSPASSAGLQKGDIITKLGTKKITSLAEFRYELYKHKVGEEIDITVIRNGKEQTIKVKLGTSE